MRPNSVEKLLLKRREAALIHQIFFTEQVESAYNDLPGNPVG
jgi:hypothetical protein